MLACSEYFLGCLRPCLTKAKEVKGAEDDLTADASIWGVSAKDTSAWGTSS